MMSGETRNNGKTTVPRRKQYHHGDLAEALLGAAERMLERHGVAGLTLRACAREAGVSHAAPAHHFADKDALLSALARRAFDRLGAFMERYAREAEPDPRAVLPAMGVAYIDFALRHQGMYRLMFSIDARTSGDAGLASAAGACHGRLREAVAAALRGSRGQHPLDQDVDEAAALAWSVVHGFATLAIEGHLDDAVGDDGVAAGSAGRHGMLLDYAGRILMRLNPVFAAGGG